MSHHVYTSYAWRSRTTTALRPICAAMCSGVHPATSGLFNSVLCLMNCFLSRSRPP